MAQSRITAGLIPLSLLGNEFFPDLSDPAFPNAYSGDPGEAELDHPD